MDIGMNVCVLIWESDMLLIIFDEIPHLHTVSMFKCGELAGLVI